MKRFFEKLVNRIKTMNEPKWVVAKCGWPFTPGWATYRPQGAFHQPTILDTGLSREEAEVRRDQLNAERAERIRAARFLKR